MKNKKLSAFGLLYSLSFKKVLITIVLYFIACLALSLALFHASSESISYNRPYDIIYVTKFLKTPYFYGFTKALYFLIFYFSISATSRLMYTEDNLLSRCQISKRNLSLTSFVYFLVMYLLASASFISTTFIMLKLYHYTFPNAIYNLPYLFNYMAGDVLLAKMNPLVILQKLILPFIALVLAELGILKIQSKGKIPEILNIIIASLLTLLFV